MKIPVYRIETVTPKTSEEYEEICDILNLPSLKYGSAEFIGELDSYITKTSLKKAVCTSARFYDRKEKIWKNGFLLIGGPKKYFVVL